MNQASKIIERLRMHPSVKSADTPVGVITAICKDTKIDDENGNNDMLAVITTDDIDLDDEVIVQDALDFSYLTANSQLFVDHVYDTLTHTAGFLRGPLGAWPSTKDHRGWRARVKLYDNAAGEAIKLLVQQSGQIGLSIGFYPTDYGPLTDEEKERYTRNGKTPSSIIRSASVFEFSFTALPCNVSCQGQLVSSGGDGKQVAVLRDLVESGQIDRNVAKLFEIESGKKIRVATPYGVVVKTKTAI